MLPGCNGMGSPAISAEPGTPDLGTDHGICLPPSGLQRQDEIRFGPPRDGTIQYSNIRLYGEKLCVWEFATPHFPPPPILCERCFGFLFPIDLRSDGFLEGFTRGGFRAQWFRRCVLTDAKASKTKTNTPDFPIDSNTPRVPAARSETAIAAPWVLINTPKPDLKDHHINCFLFLKL